MMKLSKKADYGLIALKHLAMHRREESCSAGDIADIYKMSTPLMAKVLQKLAKGGLVAARHGSSGGYTLAREACVGTNFFSMGEPLKRVNDSILEVLGKVTISQMTDEFRASEMVEL